MYTLYAAQHCPPQLLEKYPLGAKYLGEVYVFGETLEGVSGVPAGEIIDLSQTPLTKEQLDEAVDRLLTILGPAEVWLSKEQGVYLHTTRFPTEPEAGS